MLKKPESSQNRVLIVASDNEFRGGMRAMLEKEGYDVLSRQSVERTILLLEMTDIALIVSDYELEDGTFYDLLKAIRGSDIYYSDTPIYCIGSNPKTEECVKALEMGADDYSCKPLKRPIVLARVGKVIRALIKLKNNPVSLEVRVDDGEIPGFFQFLEAENKTGLLKATCKKDTAEISFQAGQIVKAETEYCAAQDALTEVLSWPFCHLRFIEKSELEGDFDISLNVSATLMDCVLGVDEYKEVLQNYPDLEASFKSGLKPLPKNSNRVAKKVHRMASSGTTLDALLDSIKLNRRHLILLIDQLVQMGHLAKAEEPFNNYIEEQKKQYKTIKLFRKTIPPIVNSIERLNCNKIQELETLVINTKKEPGISVPKLFIAGDHPELNDIFFKTIHKIAGNIQGKKSRVKSSRSNESFTELSFDDFTSLDLHKLPPKLDEHFLTQLDEKFSETICVYYIVSGLNRDVARKNRKSLKFLRDHFRGQYFIIIPNLNPEQPAMNIDCKHCSHILAIDIDHEGSIGNCPICNTEITIPECLDYSAECLGLTPDVPRVFLNPLNAEECRDILTLSFNSLLYSLPTI